MQSRKINRQNRPASSPSFENSQKRSNLGRYFASAIVVGAYLLILWASFFQIGINILKDVRLTCVALGLGASIPVMVAYRNARRRWALKTIPIKPLPLSEPLNELKNIPAKTQTLTRSKEIGIPMLARIRRGYGKKQQEKSTSLLSKIKSFFSSHKKPPVDKVLIVESHDDVSTSTNQVIESLKESSTPSVLLPEMNKEIESSKNDKKIRKNKKIIKKYTPKNINPENKADIKENTDEEETSSETEDEIPLLVPCCDPQFKFLFKSTNDNVYVDKKRLPESFLKFAELVHQLIKQNLILTGGAVTALLLKIDQFNDLDCIVFEDKNKLLKLLQDAKQDNIQYHCKIVSKKYPILKVILAEEAVSPCEYIYLPSSTETHFLNFSILSSSAYIRTSNSLFYLDKRNNTCVEIKCHESVAVNSLCNQGMLKLLDKEMRRHSPAKPLTLNELNQIKSITNHAHARLIEVDISCCKNEGDILENEIKKNLARRDFKLSALFVKILINYHKLLIRGFNGGISSVNHELISPVDPKALFKNPEDILRIFRLANIMLQYPKFESDKDLKLILEETNFKLLFKDFLFNKNGEEKEENPENIEHLRQVNTKINKLFLKNKPENIIKILCKLDVIEAMTALTDYEFLLDTAEDFANYVKTVPNHYKKTSFYYFLHLHSCLSLQNSLTKTLMNKVQKTLEPEVEAPEFEMYIDYIERNTLNRMFPKKLVPFNPDSAFIKMMVDIKSKFRDKNQKCEKSSEVESDRQRLSHFNQLPLSMP